MRAVERCVLLLLALTVLWDKVRPASAEGEGALSSGEFALVDAQKRKLGGFELNRDGLPQLVLADKDGRGRIVIGLRREDGGTALVAITDKTGAVRVGLIGKADGEHEFQLADAKNGPRISLVVGDEGRPRVSFMSAKQQELVALTLDAADLPHLAIVSPVGDANFKLKFEGSTAGAYFGDKNPTPRAGLELDSQGVAHVFAADAAGKARAELTAPSDGAPSVSIKDKGGKKLPLK